MTNIKIEKILFLCTGNSCRSQMAEGWTKQLWPKQFKVFSAGLEAHGLNPLAVAAMKAAGVDISRQISNTLEDLTTKDFDYVITVCGHADKRCPHFPGKTRVIHVGFDDPPKLAKDAKTKEEALTHYQRVRDEIRRFVEELPEFLKRIA